MGIFAIRKYILRHVIVVEAYKWTRQVESIKDYGDRQFSRSAGFYRRFIDGFSKIAKSMTEKILRKESSLIGEKGRELLSRKANVVADALSRKERIEPLRVRALVMTIGLDLPKRILEAQIEAQKPENIVNEDVEELVTFLWRLEIRDYARISQVEILYPSWFRKDVPRCEEATSKVPRIASTTRIRSGSGIYKQWILFTKILSRYKVSDTIWVIVVRLTKLIVARHGIPASIICDRDGRFTSNFWRSFQKALGTDISMSTAYHPETDGQSERPSQTLEGHATNACVIDFGKAGLCIAIAEFSYNNSYPEKNGKDRPNQAKDASGTDRKRVTRSEAKADGIRSWRQSYAQGLTLERSRTVRLELPQELSRVHHTFHVSNLKKCYADEPLVMPLEGIHVDDKLQFVEEPVEIMGREIKRPPSSPPPPRRRRPDTHWLRFARTLGGALSSPGNVKIRSNKNTHNSSQTGLRHLLQGLKL
ncbi:putative reverse transcriptase domain-containing protein [Tanacetum coccineum]